VRGGATAATIRGRLAGLALGDGAHGQALSFERAKRAAGAPSEARSRRTEPTASGLSGCSQP